MLFVNEKYNPIYKIMSEGTFKGDGDSGDYSKYNYTYPLAVIDKLLNKEKVRLGEHGEDGEIDGATLTDKQVSSLTKLKEKIVGTTSKDFNKAIDNPNYNWRNIFKGDFSGYSKGLASKNKGNAFEQEFIDNFKEYEPRIREIVDYNKIVDVSPDGSKNQKRPLTFSSGSITCGPAGSYDIGHTVTDVTLTTDEKKKIYLSLKYGTTVTFVNAGIKTLFTKGFFINDEPLSKNASMLLKMLCIDTEKFKDVFNSYKVKEPGKKGTRAKKESIPITSELKRNKIFKTFMKSVMGFGFILVHKNKSGDVDFIDLTTEDALNDFISDITEAHIEYPENGEAKRVDVIVNYPKIKFKINIRSKDGGILPTHLDADYTFTGH